MGLLKTAAKVAVASSVHGKVQRRQQQRWAAQDAASQQMLAHVHPAPVVPAPPVAEDPMVTQLKQLAELRDAGVLTEEEFAAKKAKLLGI